MIMWLCEPITLAPNVHSSVTIKRRIGVNQLNSFEHMSFWNNGKEMKKKNWHGRDTFEIGMV